MALRATPGDLATLFNSLMILLETDDWAISVRTRVLSVTQTIVCGLAVVLLSEECQEPFEAHATYLRFSAFPQMPFGQNTCSCQFYVHIFQNSVVGLNFYLLFKKNKTLIQGWLESSRGIVFLKIVSRDSVIKLCTEGNLCLT